MIYDVIIVGGGIVGLATAYQILNSKPNLKNFNSRKRKFNSSPSNR